ncbi:MAG TPA: transposase [Gammaproteobacteria bacterium]|nr:transposase [Gammaproteobacteria bacterium]
MEKLKHACDKHDCDLHAYALMTNHCHFLMTPQTEEGIGKVIQMLGRYYVQYFNRKYERTGTLWEGRYKATLIDSVNYLLICSRYIELNPVRAQMVAHPSEYPWSSYRFSALGQVDGNVSPHSIYTALGKKKDQRQKAYRALFKARIPEKTLTETREATNKSWLLGSKQFEDKIQQKLNRRSTALDRGGDHKSVEFRSQNINRV